MNQIPECIIESLRASLGISTCSDSNITWNVMSPYTGEVLLPNRYIIYEATKPSIKIQLPFAFTMAIFNNSKENLTLTLTNKEQSDTVSLIPTIRPLRPGQLSFLSNVGLCIHEERTRLETRTLEIEFFERQNAGSTIRRTQFVPRGRGQMDMYLLPL